MSGNDLVPRERSVGHVQWLAEQFPTLALTSAHVARLAGVAPSTWHGKGPNVRRATEEAILAVQPEHVRLLPPAFVDAHPARVHVLSLLEEVEDSSPRAIARATGLSHKTIHSLLRGQPTVRSATNSVILATRPSDVRPRILYVACEPSVLRIRALAAIGWPLAALGEMLGHDAIGLSKRPAGTTIGAILERRVRDLYVRLCETDGPSSISRRLASASGWQGPDAYDDDMRPLVAEDVEQQWRARLDLCILGLTLDERSTSQIREALRVGEKAIIAARRRAGIRVESSHSGFTIRETRPGARDAIRDAIRPVHYRADLDLLDTPGLDYIALLALACQEHAADVSA